MSRDYDTFEQFCAKLLSHIRWTLSGLLAGALLRCLT